MKRLLVSLLALTLLLGLGGVSLAEGEGNYGGTLIDSISGDPMSFNPSISADDNLYPAAQNMFNRLVKMDASKNVIPDLASSWEVSEDALTITFHLKENAKWWDGESVTADDVVYTFTYMKEHSTVYFSSRLADVVSIEAIDDYTVSFTMSKPDVSFIARLGWYGTFVLPEHIFNNGQTWEENPASKTPVGSGPFMFSEYKQGESITLVKNPNYHDGAPYLDKVIFSIIPDETTAMQAMLNGEVDTNNTVPSAYVDQLLSNPDFRMDRNYYPSPYRLIFNVNADVVKDPAIRWAIAYCINRDEISNKAFGGVMPPEYSVYPSMIAWAANTEDTYPAFDVAKAVETLEKAGYTKDAEGYYVRGITLDMFDSPGFPDMGKLITAACKEAGIEIVVQIYEYNAWSEKVGKNRDFMIEAQGGFMGPDPAALRDRFGTDSGSNYAGYSNAEFDELMVKSVATGDQAERAEYLKAAQKLILDDMVAINIVGYAGYEASRADIANLPIDGAGKWGWNEYTYTYFKK